jgi:azurin
LYYQLVLPIIFIRKKIIMSAKKLLSTTLLSASFAMLIAGASMQAQAADTCAVSVDATAAMAFSTKSIDVPKSCKKFTINLKNTGTLAKAVMGHNLVITKADDKDGVAEDGIEAGLGANYVKAKDARVVAATKVIGGGEAASVKFKVSKLKADQSYVFFCSFPGHSGMMKGTINLI